MKYKKYWWLFFVLALLLAAPSCNSNKIACPTYADSFPEKKAKKGKQQPNIPKATKPKSGVLPPNYGKKRQKAD